MFADSLLENHWTNHGGRGWTTLAWFALQTFAIAIRLMLPLIYTEGIPRLHLVSMSAALPLPGPPPMGSHHPSRGIRQSNVLDGLVVSSPNIPIGVEPVIDDSPPEEGVACSPAFREAWVRRRIRMRFQEVSESLRPSCRLPRGWRLHRVFPT